MSVRKRFRDFRNWYPQPPTPLPTKLKRYSMPIAAMITATLIFTVSFSVYTSSLMSHPSIPLLPLSNVATTNSSSDDWSMFHANPSHSGVATGNPVLNPTLVWKYTTGNSIASSPAISNGVVYIGSDDKNLYAFNSTNGDKLWNYSIGGIVPGGSIPPTVASSPAVANGIVYIGSLDITFTL